MSDASFASLSPTLLARKGGARPAMRPQHGMAGKIAERSPLALKLTRSAVEEGLHASFEKILALEVSHLLTCIQEENYRERVDRRIADHRSQKP